MSRLRDNQALCDELNIIIYGRDKPPGDLGEHLTAILDAVDRHLTQAGPVTRYQCPPSCLQGLPIHSEGCPNRPSTPPQAGHRGTPGEATDVGTCSVCGTTRPVDQLGYIGGPGPGGHHAALVAVEEVVNVVIERCAKAVEKGLSAGTDGLHVENDTALALASRALGAAPAAPPGSLGAATCSLDVDECHRENGWPCPRHAPAAPPDGAATRKSRTDEEYEITMGIARTGVEAEKRRGSPAPDSAAEGPTDE